MALALLLAATPLGSSQTRCSLIAPESRKPCTLGHSFGCDDGPEPRRMWVNYGCRGDFLCGGRTVHCGATGIYMTTRTGQRRNCTCALRTDADGVHAPPPKQVSEQRLRNNASYGQPRFVPSSFEEVLHSTFALWDVLDAHMREYEPSHLYATGYVRELQLRRMLQLARACTATSSTASGVRLQDDDEEPAIETAGRRLAGGSRRGSRRRVADMARRRRPACNYCEVGMNGGHSTVAMLLANPRLTAHVFDMMAFGYSPHVARLLRLRFGDRFQLHAGDSHSTLKPWASAFRANGSRCDLLFVDGDHSENGAHMDVADLQPAATRDSHLVMDDISVGPGCVMRRLARAGVLNIAETYGPFDAPSPHNPCMRGAARRHGGTGRSTCAPWGFAVLKYTERGLRSRDEWPALKKKGSNQGKRCYAIEGALNPFS